MPAVLLPRLILSLRQVWSNFTVPLQPHQKYNTTQCGELGFFIAYSDEDDYTTGNSHYLTYTLLLKGLGECTYWAWEWRKRQFYRWGLSLRSDANVLSVRFDTRHYFAPILEPETIILNSSCLPLFAQYLCGKPYTLWTLFNLTNKSTPWKHHKKLRWICLSTVNTSGIKG